MTTTAPPSTSSGPVRPTTSPVLPLRVRRAVLGAGVLALVGAAVVLPLARGERAAPAGLDPASLVPTIAAVDPDRFTGRLDPVPADGTATQLAGPFDEGLALADLAVAPDGAVGTVQVTGDVSTVLVLELRAGFYDRGGALLGTGRLVLRQPDFTRAYEAGVTGARYNGALPFAVPAPEDADGARSAVVTVVSLVNE